MKKMFLFFKKNNTSLDAVFLQFCYEEAVALVQMGVKSLTFC
jgi:hypothetical protein